MSNNPTAGIESVLIINGGAAQETVEGVVKNVKEGATGEKHNRKGGKAGKCC